MQIEKKTARENIQDGQSDQHPPENLALPAQESVDRDNTDAQPGAVSKEWRRTMMTNTQWQSEHLRIGMSFCALMEKELADYTREHGDTVENRRHATGLAYSRIEREFGRSRVVVRLYIQCYKKFRSHPDDFSKLTLREIASRLSPKQPGTL